MYEESKQNKTVKHIETDYQSGCKGLGVKGNNERLVVGTDFCLQDG